MIYDNVVVGSSISALGCILGLLKSKKKILCIDGSNINDSKKNEILDKKIIYCRQKLPLKNFSFERKSYQYFEPLEVLESKSFGGLSNVWGANSLRFLKNDFDQWPISYDNLKEYYEECETIMQVSHFNDELSEELKVNKNKYDARKLNLYSNFIKVFLSAKKNRENDFISGFSRVALNPDVKNCSGCFFGCDHAFSTRNHFEKLINNKDIEYRENSTLKKFSLNNNVIELEFENPAKEKILTKKLFIGAGSVQTPKIVMNSLERKIDFKIMESQYILIPCFYLGKSFNNSLEHHTLSQAQIVFKNGIKHNLGNVNYEVKYDQKLIDLMLKKKFSLISKLIPNFLKKRIFVITCQVSSNHSIYSATIRKEDQKFNIFENKNNKKKIKNEIAKQIKILGNKFNFSSFSFFSKFGNFGRGYHLGATLPMVDENKIDISKNNYLYTKMNGEINKYKNVFIIDSSNFSNIPSGSLSLTIMANALRIGSESTND
jgi:hypothetical protein